MNLPTLIAAADGVHAVDIATLARIDASTARPRPLNDGQKAFDRDSFFQTHDAYDIAEASTSSPAADADVVHVFTLTNDAREALVRDLVPLGLRKFRRGREDAARSLGDPVPGPGSDVSVVRSNRGGYQSYADLLDSSIQIQRTTTRLAAVAATTPALPVPPPARAIPPPARRRARVCDPPRGRALLPSRSKRTHACARARNARTCVRETCTVGSTSTRRATSTNSTRTTAPIVGAACFTSPCPIYPTPPMSPSTRDVSASARRRRLRRRLRRDTLRTRRASATSFYFPAPRFTP